MFRRILPLLGLLLLAPGIAKADKLSVVDGVEGQPLGQNVERVMKALDFLGFPLPADAAKELAAAAAAKDTKKIQEILDHRVLFQVSISPEARVKAVRGPA